MTIRTTTGETFVSRAEADEHGVVWLIDVEGVRYQLAVVLQGGWRIVDSTPDERTLLEAHGVRERASAVNVSSAFDT